MVKVNADELFQASNATLSSIEAALDAVELIEDAYIRNLAKAQLKECIDPFLVRFNSMDISDEYIESTYITICNIMTDIFKTMSYDPDDAWSIFQRLMSTSPNRTSKYGDVHHT